MRLREFVTSANLLTLSRVTPYIGEGKLLPVIVPLNAGGEPIAKIKGLPIKVRARSTSLILWAIPTVRRGDLLVVSPRAGNVKNDNPRLIELIAINEPA